MADRPMDDNRINDDLRAELVQVFMLGCLDYMAGEPVTDAHQMPAALGPPLVAMAEAAIRGGHDEIARLYPENPETVYQSLYQVGFEACEMIDVINLGYSPEAVSNPN